LHDKLPPESVNRQAWPIDNRCVANRLSAGHQPCRHEAVNGGRT
jgi:hypothetical protein